MKRHRSDKLEPIGYQLSEKHAKLLAQLEDGLAIDEHALDAAIQRQPDLYYRVSKELAILTSQRDAAKTMLASEEARVDGIVRMKAKRDEDEKKVTESDVRARIRSHPEIIEATAEMLRLNNAVGQFGALKEAFQQRSYMLREMVALYLQNYYATSADSMGQGRMRDADNSRVRQDMSRMRRGGRRDDRD